MLSFTSPLVLLASMVLAAPSSRYDARLARRSEGRHSQLNSRLQSPAAAVSNGTSSLYSYNWAGAAWDKENGTFTSVTGAFTVPTASGKEGAATSVSVGIDGDTCTSGMLQAGIDLTISNGKPSYHAWYEWLPDDASDFTGIEISAGDIVNVNVTTHSTTSGIATIENVTRKQKVSRNLTSTHALCGKNAEWTVQDFMIGNSWVPFANFSSVTFTHAEATGHNRTYTPDGANIINIKRDNDVLTSVSVGKSSLTIQRV